MTDWYALILLLVVVFVLVGWDTFFHNRSRRRGGDGPRQVALVVLLVVILTASFYVVFGDSGHVPSVLKTVGTSIPSGVGGANLIVAALLDARTKVAPWDSEAGRWDGR